MILFNISLRVCPSIWATQVTEGTTVVMVCSTCGLRTYMAAHPVPGISVHVARSYRRDELDWYVHLTISPQTGACKPLPSLYVEVTSLVTSLINSWRTGSMFPYAFWLPALCPVQHSTSIDKKWQFDLYFGPGWWLKFNSSSNHCPFMWKTMHLAAKLIVSKWEL